MLLGCKGQFIPKIIEGVKLHTLREGNRWHEGHIIHFYGKVRQKGMYKFYPDKTAKSTQSVKMTYDEGKGDLKIWVDGKKLNVTRIAQFIVNDGFDDVNTFVKFFFGDTKNKVYKDIVIRQLVHWTDLKY